MYIDNARSAAHRIREATRHLYYRIEKTLRQFKLVASLVCQKLSARNDRHVIRAFRRAASVPAYHQLLQERGVEPEDIRSIDDFHTHCPLLTKDNTFARYSLEQLCVPGALGQLATVLTSSGQSGTRFAYGLSTWKQAKGASDAIDLGLQYAFEAHERKTLLINCLPMGVRFSSRIVTVAETSVREDMAVSLATEVGQYYEQIILVGDPLFLKCVVDYARQTNVNWRELGRRIHLIVGEETFGENFRDYLAEHFCVDVNSPRGGLIGSSMGVGELGLNLFFETRETIRMRRCANTNSTFFEALFAHSPDSYPLPMLFVYNPLRTHVETVAIDSDGYGSLTISMTDRKAPLPLMRYQTGDVARLLEPETISKAYALIGQQPPVGLNELPVVAVLGRERDKLPDGTHVGQYKDALYANKDIADMLTGAFKLTFESEVLTVHIQLRRNSTLCPDLQVELCEALPGRIKAEQLRIWKYEEFPFGMSVDYERKFTYFA